MHRNWKVLKGILVLVNGLLFVATIAAFLASFIPPNQSGLIATCGLILPGLLIGNLLLLIFWLCLQSKWSLLPLFTLCMGFFTFNQLLSFDSPKNKSEIANKLQIGTFNMQFSKPIAIAQNEEQERLELEFEQFLHSVDNLDILGVQECGWRSQQHIEKAMNFPYNFFIPNIYTGIYSKYPIVNQGFVDFGQPVNKCLWVDVVISLDTIRFYTAHLEPNRHDGVVPLVLDQEKKEQIGISQLFGLLKYYDQFASKRVMQAVIIRDHQKKCPYPIILSGDFNDTPTTYMYQVLKKNRQDSFVEGGFGIGATSQVIPGLRIDYVLPDLNFSVLNHKVFEKRYSDHYLVTTELGW